MLLEKFNIIVGKNSLLESFFDEVTGLQLLEPLYEEEFEEAWKSRNF